MNETKNAVVVGKAVIEVGAFRLLIIVVMLVVPCLKNSISVTWSSR